MSLPHRIEFGVLVDVHGLPTGETLRGGRFEWPSGQTTGFGLVGTSIVGPTGATGVRVDECGRFVDQRGLTAAVPWLSLPDLPCSEFRSPAAGHSPFQPGKCDLFLAAARSYGGIR